MKRLKQMSQQESKHAAQLQQNTDDSIGLDEPNMEYIKDILSRI